MNRPNGSGSIERMPSGRYRFRLFVDGKRKVSPSYETRDEAVRVLEAATYELAGAPPIEAAPAPSEMTLGEYAERWLGKRKVRSVGEETRLFRNHVADSPLARLPLSEVRRRHIKEFVEELSTKKKLTAKAGGKRGARSKSSDTLSAQTVKLTYAVIRRVLNEAVGDDLIQVSPCTGYKLPRVASAVDADLDPVWTFLSEEEIEQVLSCARIPQRVRNLYATAIYTGLREGELFGLRWGDLGDLDGPRPECAARRSYTGPTKANKVRRFPLLPLAHAVLLRVRGSAENTSPDALVFPGPGGGCYYEGHDGGWGRAHREWAGIREGVRFHDLRHTCASHLLMGTWGRKWTLAEIKSYIGHASITTTERYAHLGSNHLHDLAGATVKPAAPVSDRGTPAGQPAKEIDTAATENPRFSTGLPKQ